MELSLFYTEGDNIVQVAMVDGNPQNQNVGEFANKGIKFGLNYRILIFQKLPPIKTGIIEQ